MLLLGGAPAGVPVLWSLVMFTAGATGLGAVLAWMWLRWGQWPGIVAHAVVNAVAYHLVAPATVERAYTGWFGTESGLAAALVLVASAVMAASCCATRR